jgi:hypothetical protein
VWAGLWRAWVVIEARQLRAGAGVKQVKKWLKKRLKKATIRPIIACHAGALNRRLIRAPGLTCWIFVGHRHKIVK